MRRHFQSDSYRRVLAAIELSHDAPEVEIHEITRTLGMEMIIKLVSTGLQEENDI
jgi:hypothetical protein